MHIIPRPQDQGPPDLRLESEVVSSYDLFWLIQVCYYDILLKSPSSGNKAACGIKKAASTVEYQIIVPAHLIDRKDGQAVLPGEI